MKWLAFLLVVVLLGQVVLFFYGREYRRKRKSSVIEKYNLRSPMDAWKAMANHEIPKEDREKIKKLYEGRDN